MLYDLYIMLVHLLYPHAVALCLLAVMILPRTMAMHLLQITEYNQTCIDPRLIFCPPSLQRRPALKSQ